MTDPHMIWFLAMATVVVAVLTLGTLGAAGILTRASRGQAADRRAAAPDGAVTADRPEHMEKQRAA